MVKRNCGNCDPLKDIEISSEISPFRSSVGTQPVVNSALVNTPPSHRDHTYRTDSREVVLCSFGGREADLVLIHVWKI